MKYRTFVRFVIDENGQHYVERPDDPDKLYHPITLPAAVDLSRQIPRWEYDFYKEKHLM